MKFAKRHNRKILKKELPAEKQLLHLRRRLQRQRLQQKVTQPERTLKRRYTEHKLSFRNRNYSNSAELSKHIWTLKDNNTNFTINWSILATAPAYSNKSKRCQLCLTEKFYLIRAKKPSLLNKRSELISKCRHENKFY